MKALIRVGMIYILADHRNRYSIRRPRSAVQFVPSGRVVVHQSIYLGVQRSNDRVTLG